MNLDDEIRDVLRSSARPADVAAGYRAVQARLHPASGRRRSSLRVAAFASIAIIVAAAVAVGGLEAIRHLGSGTPVVYITDDTTVPATPATRPVTTTQNATTAASQTTTTTAVTLPPAQFHASMVYDPASGRLLMFGGMGIRWDLSMVNDTWAYDPAANTWTELKPKGSVPSAWSPPVVYDPASGRVIHFGGMTSSLALRNYTWAYDPAANSWTNLNPTGSVPPERSNHQMVYDPASGRLIMFGGNLNDTWAYDPAANTWTELHPTGALPSARQDHRMVYDPVSGRVILFGGFDGNADLNDTWAYDPAANTWTELQPKGSVPPARDCHAMVCDPASGRVILFGGWDGKDDRNDTWAYDPAANTWTELQPTGTLPSARIGASMVCDLASGRLIMFGGADNYGGADGGDLAFNDTWAYDPAANTWTELHPTASAP